MAVQFDPDQFDDELRKEYDATIVPCLGLIDAGEWDGAKERILALEAIKPEFSVLLFSFLGHYLHFTPQVLSHIITAGANLNYNCKGDDLLCFAAMKEAPVLLWMLTSYKDKISLDRYSTGEYHLATCLLDNDKVNEQLAINIFTQLASLNYPLDEANADGNTPLHLALSRGYLNLALLLLKGGSDPLRENNAHVKPGAYIANYEQLAACADMMEDVIPDCNFSASFNMHKSSLPVYAEIFPKGTFTPDGGTGKPLPLRYSEERAAVFRDKLSEWLSKDIKASSSPSYMSQQDVENGADKPNNVFGMPAMTEATAELPAGSKGCMSGYTIRDLICGMFDSENGWADFCKKSIIGFILMGVFWVVFIGVIFIGTSDFS